MKKVTFAALAALTITACSSGPKFQVNGDVSGADGSVMLRMGNTMLLATVCAAKDAVPGTDFIPVQQQ